MTTVEGSPELLAKAIVLTDDEVIALGARAQKPWPSPIISVDVTDASEIASAVTRGARSLIARGLVDARETESLHGDLEGLAEPILNSGLVLSTYLVDSDFKFLAVGLATAAYVCDDDAWINEIIAPSGLHYLRQESSARCIDFARQYVESCFESGTASLRVSTDLPIPSFACAMRKWSEQEIHVAAFRQSEAFRRESMLAIDDERDALESFESFQSALTYLGL